MFPERLLDLVFLQAERGAELLTRGSLPNALGPVSQGALAGRVLPRYLTTTDHGWVEGVLDTLLAVVGQPRSEVEARLAQVSTGGERWQAWQALRLLLLRLHGFEVRACVKPVELRAKVFTEAAQDDAGDRSTVLTRVAAELGVTASDVEQGLYADLPDARVLRPRDPSPSVPELIERYNLALAQSLLWRAEQLTIHVRAQIKAVLRLARLRGLLCLAESDPADGGAILRLSGPLALFHQTIKYGHAMASWLPVLIRTPRWLLEATCVIRGDRYLWRASHRDPIGTTHVPPRRFDSKVEERLFRDLKRLGAAWEVHREADVVQIGRRIASPDFTLVNPERRLRVPVEVVGFWTPEYLRDKLDLLHRLPRDRPWVVCVDSSLRAATTAQGFGQNHVLWYTRRIDAARLLQFIEQRRARWETRPR